MHAGIACSFEFAGVVGSPLSPDDAIVIGRTICCQQHRPINFQIREVRQTKVSRECGTSQRVCESPEEEILAHAGAQTAVPPVYRLTVWPAEAGPRRATGATAFQQPQPCFRVSRASVGRRQLRMPSGLRLFAPGPFSRLGFQGLPAIGESQPEGPVARIARRSGKAAAFIGTPPEFI
jgi:hypothetical protein